MKTYEKPTFRMEKFEVEEILVDPSVPVPYEGIIDFGRGEEYIPIYEQYLIENNATAATNVLGFTWN